MGAATEVGLGLAVAAGLIPAIAAGLIPAIAGGALMALVVSAGAAVGKLVGGTEVSAGPDGLPGGAVNSTAALPAARRLHQVWNPGDRGKH